jgi:hypothetical protein
VTFEEYTCHIDWSLTVGQRRPHQTARPGSINHAGTPPARDPGECTRAATAGRPQTGATFPAEVMARAFAPEAAARVLLSSSATPQPESAERSLRRMALGEADMARA